MADLNKILDYSLKGHVPTISKNAQAKIDAHIILDKDDWGDTFSKDFIGEVKEFYSRKQGHKCGYCRSRITPDGYTEPVEHITPRKRKPHWMFVKHNLVVSCGGCNSNKGTDNVLINNENTYGDNPINCPNNSDDYRIFNPHHDIWSDHFEIENEIFLKPKPNTKGPYTYWLCEMKRYHIILDYHFQLNIRKPFTIKTLTLRIRIEKNEDRKAILKKALDTIMNSI
jgi:uncharacterized protein (TIGR02646 family)